MAYQFIGKNMMNLDIDFVIIWVDGQDEKWLSEKRQYSPEKEADNREVRFRDWGNLRYWFRGVEKYAPFVRKIFFVTWGHIPSWLDTSNPKLEIVNHRDYIPSEYLPTFNSHTIELNLHRIKGLSEHFVYFNDDVFVVSPTKPEDYFKNGLPLDIFALNTVSFGKDSVGHIIGSNMSVINENFKKKACFKQNLRKYLSPKYGKHLVRTMLLYKWHYFQGFYNNHLASNFLKSTFEEVWEKEPDILDQTCSCKFRSPTNVNQWLMKYWQLVKGSFAPMSAKAGKYFRARDNNDGLKSDVLFHKYKFICINDNEKLADFEKTKEEIIQMFEAILPEKSGFER